MILIQIKLFCDDLNIEYKIWWSVRDSAIFQPFLLIQCRHTRLIQSNNTIVLQMDLPFKLIYTEKCFGTVEPVIYNHSLQLFCLLMIGGRKTWVHFNLEGYTAV